MQWLCSKRNVRMARVVAESTCWWLGRVVAMDTSPNSFPACTLHILHLAVFLPHLHRVYFTPTRQDTFLSVAEPDDFSGRS